MKDLQTFLPLILLVLVFWFLILRPMRKRQKAITQTQQALAVGTEIMLGSGIYGTIAALHDDRAEVTIAPGTTIVVHRQAIGKVITPQNAVGGIHDDDEPTTPDAQ